MAGITSLPHWPLVMAGNLTIGSDTISFIDSGSATGGSPVARIPFPLFAKYIPRPKFRQRAAFTSFPFAPPIPLTPYPVIQPVKVRRFIPKRGKYPPFETTLISGSIPLTVNLINTLSMDSYAGLRLALNAATTFDTNNPNQLRVVFGLGVIGAGIGPMFVKQIKRKRFNYKPIIMHVKP